MESKAPSIETSSDRIIQLCSELLPIVIGVEDQNRRAVILAKLPPAPQRPIGFVLDAAVELPSSAFATPDLAGIIRAALAEYKFGEELAVVMHVVGAPSRVEDIRFKRSRFAAASTTTALAAISAAIQRAAGAEKPAPSPSTEEMDGYIDSLLAGDSSSAGKAQ